MQRNLSIIAVVVMAVLTLTMVGGAIADEPVARLLLFYSKDCGHCQVVQQEVLPPLQAKYGSQLEIRALEVGEPDNYQMLLDLETRYGATQGDLPIVFTQKLALFGEQEIRRDLDRVLAECLTAGGCEYPTADGRQSESQEAVSLSSEVHLAYFHQVGCADCDRAKYDLDELQRRYPALVVTIFDIAKPESKTVYEALSERLGVPERERLTTPAIFVGQDYLIGRSIDLSHLETLVLKYANGGSGPIWDELDKDSAEATRSIIERFKSFGLLPVMFAGLVDGVNPCAFATIIFFVSYLAVGGRRGRDILLVGAAFTSGVFIAYLLVGLGFLSLVKSLEVVTALAKAVYLGTGVFCLGLAGLSIRDYLQVRAGKLAETSLQLPNFLKERIRVTIRERARARHFVLAAFFSGFVISFLELLCTGQVYLPTIVFVASTPELRLQATLYLVMYNLMFIAPLVVVFGLVYFGTTARQLTVVLQERAGAIKLLMAAVFVMLGGWLIYASL